MEQTMQKNKKVLSRLVHTDDLFLNTPFKGKNLAYKQDVYHLLVNLKNSYDGVTLKKL